MEGWRGLARQDSPHTAGRLRATPCLRWGPAPSSGDCTWTTQEWDPIQEQGRPAHQPEQHDGGVTYGEAGGAVCRGSEQHAGVTDCHHFYTHLACGGRGVSPVRVRPVSRFSSSNSRSCSAESSSSLSSASCLGLAPAPSTIPAPAPEPAPAGCLPPETPGKARQREIR